MASKQKGELLGDSCWCAYNRSHTNNAVQRPQPIDCSDFRCRWSSSCRRGELKRITLLWVRLEYSKQDSFLKHIIISIGRRLRNFLCVNVFFVVVFCCCFFEGLFHRLAPLHPPMMSSDISYIATSENYS